MRSRARSTGRGRGTGITLPKNWDRNPESTQKWLEVLNSAGKVISQANAFRIVNSAKAKAKAAFFTGKINREQLGQSGLFTPGELFSLETQKAKGSGTTRK